MVSYYNTLTWSKGQPSLAFISMALSFQIFMIRSTFPLKNSYFNEIILSLETKFVY